MGGMAALGGLAGGFAGGFAMPTHAAGAAALIPAHIANGRGNPTLVLQEVARQQGYFEQLGLETTTVNAGGTKIISAILNGEQDISVLVGFPSVLPAIERGGKLKILAGAGLMPELTVYSKNPKVRSLKDLEGKTVGTSAPGGLLHQLMVAMFQKHGIDIKKITFVKIGGSAAVFRAVAAGIVDAGPAPVDVHLFMDKYGVHALSDGNTWIELPEFTFQGAFTAEATIAKKRDVIVRLLAGYAKLFRFINGPDSKDAWVKAWMKLLSGKDPKQSRAEAEYQWNFFQKYKPYAGDLILSKERVAYMQKLNVSLGIQKKILPYEQVVDNSLARDALKLIA